MEKRYYVTTPIYYVNARPHLGHTYSTTLADSMSRFYRYAGYESFFLTGTDEHGDKINQSAVKAGKTPQEFCDEISALFRNTWEKLGLKFDRFIRTTEPEHKKVVQNMLAYIYEKGDIYFGEYGGNYCYGCERFLTDKELVDGKCPDHQTPPQYISEKNYFFRMSKYQDRLVEHITKVQPDFIRPERYRNEVLAMLREPIEDLCISRPKTRLTWGIELPFDNNYVTYVWFDALVNYLTGIGYPDKPNFKKFWPVVEHITAKDIVKPHGIFWPTMLMAADIPLYQHLNVHGYWVTAGGKMSKSTGNVVDPMALPAEYGMDAFRYFVFREMTFGLDGTFSFEAFDTRYHADLANNLGNLVSRALAMVHKYREGVAPSESPGGELEGSLRQNAATCASDVEKLVRSMELHKALERIWNLVDAANVFIDRTKPWSLAKAEKTDPQAKIALDASLYHQLEVLRIIGSLITAFMPDTSNKILRYLGFNAEALAKQQTIAAAGVWGGLPAGVKIEKGETLFPRKEPSAEGEKQKPVEPTPAIEEGLISIDEFGKVKLRVGQVMAAERLPKSEKLLKLSVDLGEATGPRQILAGIAKHYEPENLIGRKVAVVANLKPAKLMGLQSQGMLLAASDSAGNLELVGIGPAMAPGSEIR